MDLATEAIKKETLLKLILRWGIFHFYCECEHVRHDSNEKCGVLEEARKIGRHYPLGQALARCSRTLTHHFLVPQICDTVPHSQLGHLFRSMRLIIVSPELEILQTLAEQCDRIQIQLTLHFKFTSFCQLAGTVINPVLPAGRKRERLLRKRQFQLALNRLISHRGLYEVEAKDCMFENRQRNLPVSSLSSAVRRISLPSGYSDIEPFCRFSSLFHMTLKTWYSGPFPPHLTHLHLDRELGGWSHLPPSLECLCFKVSRQLSNEEWEDLFKRCRWLRKLTLLSMEGTLPSCFFTQPSLRLVHCYHYTRPILRLPSFDKLKTTDNPSRISQLSLDPSVLDDPSVSFDLPCLTKLSFEGTRIFSIWDCTVKYIQLPPTDRWPKFLGTLVLSNDFSGSLAPLKNLTHLRFLRLGGSFNCPIHRDDWPPGLRCLVILTITSTSLKFPREDLSDLDRFGLSCHLSKFTFHFDFLPPSLSVLLVGQVDPLYSLHQVIFETKPHPFQVTIDSRFPNCRLCGFRSLLS